MGLFTPLAVALLLSVAGAAHPKVQPAAPGKGRTDHKNCYIVQLNPGVSEARHGQLFDSLQGTNGMKWARFGSFSKCDVQQGDVERLANDPDVALIEEDSVVSVNTVQDVNCYCWDYFMQNYYLWNLDRVDQPVLPRDLEFHYSSNGSGVVVYVVDTGINVAHQEFTGRWRAGANFVGVTTPDSNWGDCNGHGTHVAGTAVGTTVGVAKGATVVPVRVLDCTGTGAMSTIVAGFNWAVSQGSPHAVINLSIGGGLSTALNNAIGSAVTAGVHVVVAAGNNGADACNYSPSSAPAAITVGNVDNTDTRASTSNYGSCVDLFAPGTSIYSASYSSTTGYAWMTGTSMSSPLVAGAVASYLSAYPSLTPSAMRTFLVSGGTLNQLKSIGTNSPNVLLRSNVIPILTVAAAEPEMALMPTLMGPLLSPDSMAAPSPAHPTATPTPAEATTRASPSPESPVARPDQATLPGKGHGQRRMAGTEADAGWTEVEASIMPFGSRRPAVSSDFRPIAVLGGLLATLLVAVVARRRSNVHCVNSHAHLPAIEVDVMSVVICDDNRNPQ